VARPRQADSARRGGHTARTALIAVVVILAGVGVGLLVAPHSHSSARADHAGHQNTGRAAAPDASSTTPDDQSRQIAALPAPAQDGLHIGRAQVLHDGPNVTRWAPVKLATSAYTRPSTSSPVVTAVSATTAEGTTNLVTVDEETTRDGQTWVHAHLAVLPDGRTGWIPRSALGGWNFVDTKAVVSRTTLTLTLYKNGRAIFTTPVGVGKSTTPTPGGQFYVRDKLTSYASPEYGPLAFGTSARSEHETDWPAGGFIGIHGTDQPDLVPGHISHGCIRLRNQAIVTLGHLMPVGTPVTIQ
jgi:lipoprotein-anchoring transpeptidase ErfK/SrfK